VNANHLSAQELNTTTTNKNCSALKIKVCWVMKHQLQVIITECYHHKHLGNVGKPLEILGTNYIILPTAYLLLEHSRHNTCSTLLS